MSETIAITGKSVKLLKGHYTSVACAMRRLKGLTIPPRIVFRMAGPC
ncbi:MAG: hypothetical protein ACREYE_15105 [Gammaproteobacteria bacterium]